MSVPAGSISSPPRPPSAAVLRSRRRRRSIFVSKRWLTHSRMYPPAGVRRGWRLASAGTTAQGLHTGAARTRSARNRQPTHNHQSPSPRFTPSPPLGPDAWPFSSVQEMCLRVVRCGSRVASRAHSCVWVRALTDGEDDDEEEVRHKLLRLPALAVHIHHISDRRHEPHRASRPRLPRAPTSGDSLLSRPATRVGQATAVTNGHRCPPLFTRKGPGCTARRAASLWCVAAGRPLPPEDATSVDPPC